MIWGPPYGRIDGAVSKLGLELKVNNFSGFLLQEEYSLPSVFYTKLQFLGTECGKGTDFGPFTCIYAYVCTNIM
jgi:hypothetical protein